MAGRPRALDLDAAVPVVLRVFWEHGYSGRTLDQIAAELGVTKPTLSRTLGDKEAMFVAALDEYYQSYIAPAEAALVQANSLRSGLAGFFAVFVERILDDQLPPGCFMGDSATSGELHTDGIAETMQSLQTRLTTTVHQRIEAAIAAVELAPGTSPIPILQFVLGQVSALAAISRTGPAREQLDIVVHCMLAGLPWAVAPNGTASSS